MAEPFTIYKLTILNMLDKVDFPLTNTQISDFFLEQEYTDYFRVQQVLNDLADSGLIRTESTHSNTQYYITAAGRETLDAETQKVESVLLRSRLREGLPIAELATSGRTAVAGLIADELVNARAALAGRIELTLRGRLLADAVVRRLLD